MKNWIKKAQHKLRFGAETRKSVAETAKKLAWRGSAFFALFGGWFSEEKALLILSVAVWWIVWMLVAHVVIAYRDTS